MFVKLIITIQKSSENDKNTLADVLPKHATLPCRNAICTCMYFYVLVHMSVYHVNPIAIWSKLACSSLKC